MALLPLALALVVWNTAWQLSSGTAANALPASTFESLAGEKQALAAGGKPKVINLWASWCPPCRREMPMMAKTATSAEGIQFIFANQCEIALDTVLLDRFGDLGRHYGAPGLPATLFIDKHGVLKHAHLGEISRETLQSQFGELRSDKTVLRRGVVTASPVPADKSHPQFLIIVFHHKVSTYLGGHLCIRALSSKRVGKFALTVNRGLQLLFFK